MESMLGSRIAGRYEVTGVLGRGGMGVVYRARDPLLSRDVAVKVIPPSLMSATAEERFSREAQLVAQMDHPAIIAIHDFGRHHEALFFVMPLVRGTSLRSLLEARSLTVDDVLQIGIAVADALDYSHSRGVIHRDIKPENIMITRESNTMRVRVMDFGLAASTTAARITKTDTLLGTFAYCSPEQIAANELDNRSDIYSLATVLFECLAGHVPFTAELPAVLYQIAHAEPPTLRSLRISVDENLEAIIMRCLSKRPDKRPARAAEVSEQLRSIVGRAHQALTPVTPIVVERRPIIGRRQELEQIASRFDDAASGHCQLVLVGAEAGVGKTRLLQEIRAFATSRAARVMEGRVVEEDHTPYQGFIGAIEDHVRGSAESPLGEVAGELAEIFPSFRNPRSSKSSGGGNLQRAVERHEIYDVLARTFALIAADSTLVLLLEHLHEADVSIDALQQIVRRLPSVRILIVGTYRSSEIDRAHPLRKMIESWSGESFFLHLMLEPPDLEEHRQLVQQQLDSSVTDDVVKRLFDATEGNPLFTRELVRSLRENGSLRRDATGTWAVDASQSFDSAPLPATIQQTIERRLARLGREASEVLSVAAVLGNHFDSVDLEAVGESINPVEQVIEALVRDGLLELEDDRGRRLGFSSGILRDVVYKALSRSKRRSLHRRVAEHFERRYAHRRERVFAPLAFHFAAGDIAERAVYYGLGAARQSLEVFSADDARRDLRMVLDFIEADDWSGEAALEADARMLLARAEAMRGLPELALQEVQSAITILEPEGASEALLLAMSFAAEQSWQSRNISAARYWIDQGIVVAREIDARQVLSKLLVLGATVAKLRGDSESAERMINESGGIESLLDEGEIQNTTSGGSITVPIGGGVLRSLDPVTAAIREHSEVLPCIFETLSRVGKGANAAPWLASEIHREDGGRRYHFRIRDGVRFHDGKLLSARDVKYTIERLLRFPDSEGQRLLVPIVGADELTSGRTETLEGFEQLSDAEFRLHLSEPIPFFAELVSDSPTAIVPEGTIEVEGTWRTRCIGTGPFRVIAFQPGKSLQLERHPDYWRSGYPRCEELSFEFGVAPETIIDSFREGRFHFASDLLPHDVEELRHDSRFASRYFEVPRLSTYWLAFNAGRGRFSDIEARSELRSLINLDTLLPPTIGRLAARADTLVPPGLLGGKASKRREGQTEQERMLTDEYRAERLRGVSSEVTVAVSPVFLAEAHYRDFAQALFGSFERAGLHIRVVNHNAAGLFEALHEGSVDLVLARWAADYPDADSFIHGMLTRREGFVGRICGSERIDVLIRRARSETETSLRQAIYREIEEILTEQCLLVPLYYEKAYRFVHPDVRGVSRLNFIEPIVNYENLRIVK